jgi:hypothetical protein
LYSPFGCSRAAVLYGNTRVTRVDLASAGLVRLETSCRRHRNLQKYIALALLIPAPLLLLWRSGACVMRVALRVL